MPSFATSACFARVITTSLCSLVRVHQATFDCGSSTSCAWATIPTPNVNPPRITVAKRRHIAHHQRVRGESRSQQPAQCHGSHRRVSWRSATLATAMTCTHPATCSLPRRGTPAHPSWRNATGTRWRGPTSISSAPIPFGGRRPYGRWPSAPLLCARRAETVGRRLQHATLAPSDVRRHRRRPAWHSEPRRGGRRWIDDRRTDVDPQRQQVGARPTVGERGDTPTLTNPSTNAETGWRRRSGVASFSDATTTGTSASPNSSAVKSQTSDRHTPRRRDRPGSYRPWSPR